MSANVAEATSSVDQDMLWEVRDGIGHLTFNRPQARNAFTFAMYERLAEIARGVKDDPSIKVLILTGAGEKAFASGTDIACLCSSDEIYAADAEMAAGALKAAGATRIFLAGRPGEHDVAWRAAGVTGYLGVGANLPEMLGELV